MTPSVVIIICAYNEAPRLPATIAALREALPAARIVVSDDCSTDRTLDVAHDAGAEVIKSTQRTGKGGAANRALPRARELADELSDPVFLLCDADLGNSARYLVSLVEAVGSSQSDMAVASFAVRVGGGFGIVVRFARWLIRRRVGLRLSAPLSGQRALNERALGAAVPFAGGFAIEVGMTIDVARGECRVREIELPLQHRATGRDFSGFVHRARQLRDLIGLYLQRN